MHVSNIKIFFIQLNENQIQKLFINLGIDADEGLGLAYHALVPYIMQALEH